MTQPSIHHTVHTVKYKIHIVCKEPTLFDRTIAENIQYGNNSREVNMEEVIEVARQANIHSFISSLPSGYETRWKLTLI